MGNTLACQDIVTQIAKTAIQWDVISCTTELPCFGSTTVFASCNHRFREMMDRYLIIHDEEQPLELNVIANYEAGETRSTKNLSGGESFIVSLALAFGLSQMVSRNVRVDSLIQGFGTIDEDTLEPALETLAGLRQDGKRGVISPRCGAQGADRHPDRGNSRDGGEEPHPARDAGPLEQTRGKHKFPRSQTSLTNGRFFHIISSRQVPTRSA